MRERKIGDIFKSNGKTFVVIESGSLTCEGCCLQKLNCFSYKVGACYPYWRSDNKNVIIQEYGEK